MALFVQMTQRIVSNMKIIVATRNEGKVVEIKKFFEGAAAKFGQPFSLEVLSLDDIGLDIDLDAIEDGTTFEENAVKKVQAVRDALHNDEVIILADDSGLEIDAMDGLPGVDSANFMGRNTPYTVRFEHILAQMGDKQRTARFVAVMAIVHGGVVKTVRATMEGEIAKEPVGTGGFGYDPIFFVPQFGKTSAELSMEQKNQISHRGKALMKVVEFLYENSGV